MQDPLFRYSLMETTIPRSLANASSAVSAAFNTPRGFDFANAQPCPPWASGDFSSPSEHERQSCVFREAADSNPDCFEPQSPTTTTTSSQQSTGDPSLRRRASAKFLCLLCGSLSLASSRGGAALRRSDKYSVRLEAIAHWVMRALFHPSNLHRAD